MPKLLISDERVVVDVFSAEKSCMNSWELDVDDDDFKFSKTINVDDYDLMLQIEEDYLSLLENEVDIDIRDSIIRMSPFATLLYLIGLSSRHEQVRQDIAHDSSHVIEQYPVKLFGFIEVPVSIYIDRNEPMKALIEILPREQAGR